MKLDLHFACRRYPSVAVARWRFTVVADRLFARARNGTRPTVSLALGQDPDGPGYLTIYGPDEAEVLLEVLDIGGEPVEIPREYERGLSVRREQAERDGGIVHNVVPDPGWLRADGSVQRWGDG